MALPALSHSDFRRYFLGSLLNVNAVWIQRVALVWIAWDLTGSAGFVGLIAGLSLVPSLLTGPVFGVWVDRTEILSAAAKTTSSMIVLLGLIIAVLALGWLSPLVLVIASLAVGTATSAHHPVRMSLAPRLVPPELMSGVIALTAVNFNVARLIAPVIAGALIASVGVLATLAIAAILLAPMLLILPTLSPRALPSKTGPAPSLGTAFREGVRHARSTPLIWRCILVMAVYTFAARGVLELLPVIADGEFGRGATGLGLLTGAAGAGALVSASFLALSADRAPTTTDIPTSVYVALLVSQILVALIAVTPSWSLMLVLIACLGASSTMVGVSLQTVIQNRLVDEMRGRVMSLWIMTGFGMAALGAFAIGTVAQFTSIGAASAGSGLIGLILVSVLLFAPKGTFAAR